MVDWLVENFGIPVEIQVKILLSVLSVVVLSLLRFIILKLVYNKMKDVKHRYHWKNGVKNTFYILVILVISAIWFDQFESLATFLGIVTAGLAIALADPIVNLAGWIFIVLRKPFEVGDRIQIGDHAGDVIDQRYFQFTLNEIGNWVDADQSTGRIIHVPNGKVFKVTQANYSQGFSHIWNEIDIVLTFESNWVLAKDILQTIVDKNVETLPDSAQRKLIEASKKFMIFYKTLTPILYTKVVDHGVKITLRYLILPHGRRTSEHVIWEAVLHEFAKHDDIDFAYPTTRVYYNHTEGKPGLRAA